MSSNVRLKYGFVNKQLPKTVFLISWYWFGSPEIQYRLCTPKATALFYIYFEHILILRVPSEWNSLFKVSKYRTAWFSRSPMSAICLTHPILLYLAAAIITRNARIMNVSFSSNTMLRRVFQLTILSSAACSHTLQYVFLQAYIFPYLCVFIF